MLSVKNSTGFVQSLSNSARAACSIITLPGRSRDSLKISSTFLAAGFPATATIFDGWARPAPTGKSRKKPTSQTRTAAATPDRQLTNTNHRRCWKMLKLCRKANPERAIFKLFTIPP